MANPYSYTDKASDFVQEASTLQAAGTRQDADDASIPVSHIDGRCLSPMLLGLLKSQPRWRVRDRQQNGSEASCRGQMSPFFVMEISPLWNGNPLVCFCSRKCVQGLLAALFSFAQSLHCARCCSRLFTDPNLCNLINNSRVGGLSSFYV